MTLPSDISPATLALLVIIAIFLVLVFGKIIKWGIKLIISLALVLLIVGFFLYLLT